MKNNVIEKILLEWSLNVENGCPDVSKKEDVEILKRVLEEIFDIEPNKKTIISEIMKSLIEKSEDSPKEEPTEKPKKETPPKEEQPKEEPPKEKQPSDSEKKPTEKEPSETDIPEPPNGGGESNSAPTKEEPEGEEKTSDEEPKKEEPIDTTPKEEPENSAATQQAYQNMKNAEMSGLYFFRPTSAYNTEAGASSKYEIEGVYELQNGVMMMKVGPDEHQINFCPYTGYSAAVQLPKIDKELLSNEKNKVTLKSPDDAGGEEEK